MRADEAERAQQQVGRDAAELAKRCKWPEAAKLPEGLRERAAVKAVSEKGTTQRDQELKKARLKAMEEKEERARARRKEPIPTLEGFKESARQRQALVPLFTTKQAVLQ